MNKPVVGITAEQREIARLLGLKPDDIAGRAVFHGRDVEAEGGGMASFSTRNVRDLDRQRRSRMALHQTSNDDDIDFVLSQLADDVKSALALRKARLGSTGERLDATVRVVCPPKSGTKMS